MILIKISLFRKIFEIWIAFIFSTFGRLKNLITFDLEMCASFNFVYKKQTVVSGLITVDSFLIFTYLARSLNVMHRKYTKKMNFYVYLVESN